MKILIVDDKNENLVAAQMASQEFPTHQITFSSSATTAPILLPYFDALITDLFFLDVLSEDSLFYQMVYANYVALLNHREPTFRSIVQDYYDGNMGEALEKLQVAKYIALEGKIPISDLKTTGAYIDDCVQPESPQFPYGAALMMQAHEVKIRCCLVSDIHRHAGGYYNMADSVDAMCLLLPLMVKGVLTIEQTKQDGKDSLTYMGQEQLMQFSKAENPKADPLVWVEAISRVLAQ